MSVNVRTFQSGFYVGLGIEGRPLKPSHTARGRGLIAMRTRHDSDAVEDKGDDGYGNLLESTALEKVN